jgi:PAS domain-containing protein
MKNRNPSTHSSGGARDIMERSPYPLLVLDEEGVVRYANAAVGKIVDDGPSALLGRRLQLPCGADRIARARLILPCDRDVPLQVCSTEFEWDGRRAYLASCRKVGAINGEIASRC